jgi:signal transduction histidine kinase
MKRTNFLTVLLTITLLLFCLSYAAAGQEKATASEIVSNVQAAANSLSKSGEPGLAEFNKKPSQWVWKDTYIFVLDCGKGMMAAHPMKPELVGKDILTMKDRQGKLFFGDLCGATKKASGLWVDYSWPKPGETAGSRKISYAYKVNGTHYVVAAGIYDDKASLAELEKIGGTK